MSCKNCDLAQGKNSDGALQNMTYVRVGPANVLIAGCDEHLKALIKKLRSGSENEPEQG